jgi:hypothetical protein
MPIQPRSNFADSSCAAASRAAALAVFAVLLMAGAGGCQFGPGVQRHQLIQHQALIDFSGLKPAEAVEAVRVQASPPASWVLHGIERHALYNHQQWKSPTARTAVGVIYARLPLPISADTLLWLGRQQYAKQSADGKDLGNWTDSVGRRWFEAETNKYHCRGYAIASGLDAWIVYMGYKTDLAPEPADISLGARCVEMFVPVKAGEKFTVPMSRQQVTPVPDPGPGTRPATAPAVAAAPAAGRPDPSTRPAAGGAPSDPVKAKAGDVLQFLSKGWASRAAGQPSGTGAAAAPVP